MNRQEMVLRINIRFKLVNLDNGVSVDFQQKDLETLFMLININ